MASYVTDIIPLFDTKQQQQNMDSATLLVSKMNVDIKSQKVNEKQNFVRTEILMFVFLYLHVFNYLNILCYLTFNSLYFQFKDG